MRIIAAHLLNDYSGSPKVLMQLLKGWNANGIETIMFTSKSRTGFLSNIEKTNYAYFKYNWAANPVLRLFNLVKSQVELGVKIFRQANKSDIIYVNTVLPFGAAIAGKLLRCKVVYHLHETSIKPAILKWFLFGIVKLTATDVVYVSSYLAENELIKKAKKHILPNAITNDFLERAKQQAVEKTNLKNVLMVCSLKAYKGVNEFVQLANTISELNFKLVLNAPQAEIEAYFNDISLPQNLTIFDTQTDLHSFYNWADLVLNLSKPTEWIETFGLTIIEGMAYGNPAIVPPVGGITEVVNDDQNGYQLSSTDLEKIVSKIRHLSADNIAFSRLSNNALRMIDSFSETLFINKNIEILNLLNK
jgi:glycosyltransferase involved in cell wall biosynthesis